MSRPSSTHPSSMPTPVPSSPPPSESYMSELDGTAPSLLDGSFVADHIWDTPQLDPTSLNLVSWKLDVNARAEDGVEKRGFNAISTVLNHPTKKANPLRASRRPLPPIQPPPPLPKPPPPASYDAYLKNVTPMYESFISAQEAAAVAGPSRQGGLLEAPSSSSNTAGDLPDLASVPDLFFDQDFNLSNPQTWSTITSSSASSSVPRSNQDDLSTHLDTLERHLIHEITLRSSSFFSALSNLQDLHAESASCLSSISELQGSLREVGEKQADKGLEVLEAQERLRELRVAERGVKGVEEVEEMVRLAKGLVDVGDWAGGLGYLADVVRWWERHSPRHPSDESGEDDGSEHLPLSTLPALANLPEAISALTTAISTQLDAALSALLLSVLASTEPFEKEAFRHSVEPMLAGLVRCGKAGGLEDVWREVMTTTVREGSRKYLPVSQNEDDGEVDGKPPEQRGASLADSLKAMDHSRFLLLCTEMYASMLGRLRRGQDVGEELAAVLGSVSSLPALLLSPLASAPTSSDPSPSQAQTPSFDLAESLSSACELANARASKILAVRSEQHAALGLVEFVEISKECWDFVLATEGLARRMIPSLRGVTASQARVFLVAYHSQRLTKSANLVQEEQWTQIDVPPQAQHVVDLIIESAVSDPSEIFVPPRSPASTAPSANGNTVAKKTINVEDKTFFVVKATAESLILLGDYMKIVVNLELVVTDVMGRVIEFLKSFNSRTCQVVLGAGAMRSAGLKNITAKHLALASQSLSIIVSLVPYIREFIRRHLSVKQAVMLTEFDKLKRDYQEHQNEIHAKLVAIMSDRLAVHCASLREVDWEATPEKDGPRQYAEMLVKETATLHKVLSKYLAQQTVEGVMSEVLAAIVHRLGEEYGKVELKSDDAKKRMTQDVSLISVRLGPLTESGKSIESLASLVKDKPTPRRRVGETLGGLLRRSASGSQPKDNGVDAKEAHGERTGDARGEGDEDEDGSGLVAEPESVEVAEEAVGATGGETHAGETEAALGEKEGQDKDNAADTSAVDETGPTPPAKEEVQQSGKVQSPPPPEKDAPTLSTPPIPPPASPPLPDIPVKDEGPSSAAPAPGSRGEETSGEAGKGEETEESPAPPAKGDAEA